MKQSYKTKSVLVIDGGLFIESAISLIPYFGEVHYTSPWKTQFTRLNSVMIGAGIPGIIRENNWWEIIDDIDLFVFPDVGYWDEQLRLQEMGKRVWGSRRGEELETSRGAAKKYFKKIGLPVSPYAEVKGITALREYLKAHKDQWVKMNNITRGDTETFHSENYPLIEAKLDELEFMLGIRKESMPYIVESPIKDAVEIGYDGFSVDGKFPKRAMMGIETKDEAYIGKAADNAKMPREITFVNDKLAAALKGYSYRNFYSTEIRITRELTPYLIDPCMRQGSPPSELYYEMLDNLPDIMWYGAKGELVEPEWNAKYGAQLILNSEWAMKNRQVVQFPKEIRRNVKLKNLTIQNGEYTFVPQHGVDDMQEIGCVVATSDDSIEDAAEKVREIASQVKGYAVDFRASALDEGIEKIKTLKEFGIRF